MLNLTEQPTENFIQFKIDREFHISRQTCGWMQSVVLQQFKIFCDYIPVSISLPILVLLCRQFHNRSLHPEFMNRITQQMVSILNENVESLEVPIEQI